MDRFWEQKAYDRAEAGPPALQFNPTPVSEMAHIPYPDVVIEGLLRKKEILLMGGSSKAWKSWARMDLLYCASNGFDWFGFKTHKGLVLHIDLELLSADIFWRFNQIHQNYCERGLHGCLDNVLIVSLREMDFGPDDLPMIVECFKERSLSLLSLDPIYRLVRGKGESDPVAVTTLLIDFLRIASKLNVAIALLQHFTKGDQSTKDSQDRFSGSAVWSRFPDALLTFTENEAGRDTFSCEFTLRSFQPIDPFGVRWDFPRFAIDARLDPEKIKSKAGRKKESTAEHLCSIIGSDETISWTDLAHRASQLLQISEPTFRRRLAEAINARYIYHNSVLKHYGLTPEYLRKNGQ